MHEHVAFLLLKDFDVCPRPGRHRGAAETVHQKHGRHDQQKDLREGAVPIDQPGQALRLRDQQRGHDDGKRGVTPDARVADGNEFVLRQSGDQTNRSQNHQRHEHHRGRQAHHARPLLLHHERHQPDRQHDFADVDRRDSQVCEAAPGHGVAEQRHRQHQQEAVAHQASRVLEVVSSQGGSHGNQIIRSDRPQGFNVRLGHRLMREGRRKALSCHAPALAAQCGVAQERTQVLQRLANIVRGDVDAAPQRCL